MAEKKQFKAESKRLLDLMINSIYTHKEIFLRELISNASDATDKLYYKALTENISEINKSDLTIDLAFDKENRTLTVTDHGIGMNKEELEEHLGTIANSGSFKFKNETESDDIDIIGQFGVGFYSAFMVAKKVEVSSRAYGSDQGYTWVSEASDGYEIFETDNLPTGTTIKLYLKDNTEEENYDDYLDQYHIESLVKKYSDYVHYPIKMDVTTSKKKEDSDEYETYKEVITVNSMIPLWKRNKKDITKEEYNNFYSDKFFDYDKPLDVLHFNIEGNVNYNALLYIPSHAPYDYYSKEYEKGLQLYTNGVLIMDKCSELLPDYFSFVRGVIDTEDIPLNISRETLQDDKNIKLIAKSIESKVKNELLDLLKNNRDKYLEFYKAFGMQLKFGIYNDYGMHKDKLEDLIMFYSSGEKKLITLDEYVNKLKEEDKNIYYCAGETVDKIDMLPQVEGIKDKHEVLYLTDYVDEFAIMAIHEYKGKTFVNVSNESTDLSTDEEKEKINKENTDNKDMLEEMKKVLEGNVEEVKLTNKLKSHPVCLTTTGEVSTSMEKVINAMPTDEKIKANEVLEINASHKIVDKLKDLYKNDKDEFTKYTKVIYYEARLIEGLPIDNPTEMSNLMCDIMADK